MKTMNKIVMAVAGVILIAASILKSHQLLTEPILKEGFWESWLFFVIQIPLEIGLGIWLLSGLFRKAAWLIGMISFGGFILVTFQKGITGAASCGCFGKVHVNPWITLFSIDVPLFLLLLIFRPKGEKLLPPPWPSLKHFLSIAIPTFIILAGIVPVLALNKPQREEILIGEKWSWLEEIDIADSLSNAVVVVLVYHHNCPDCRQAIPLYDQICRDMGANQDNIRFAFIEAPPYCPADENIVPFDTPCLTGKLSNDRERIFATPFVVLLQDGVLIKFWEARAPQLDEILAVITEI